MDVEVQNNIHKITREGSETDTLQRHNRIIEKFIDFIIASHDENVFQINGGSLSELIEDIDFTIYGRDKENFISLKRPKTYRTKDIVWHNLPISLVKAYLNTDAMQYAHKRNGGVKVNQHGEKLYSNEKKCDEFFNVTQKMLPLDSRELLAHIFIRP